jgi:hypothetical protein
MGVASTLREFADSYRNLGNLPAANSPASAVASAGNGEGSGTDPKVKDWPTKQ